MTKVASRPFWICGSITLAVLVVVGYAWLQYIRTEGLTIYVFDLPGTPAVFVRTPNDRRVLINGGSNSEVIRKLTEVLPFYSKNLDMVIASQALGKSASGLIDILNRYSVDMVGIVAATTSDAVYDVFLDTAQSLGIKTKELGASDEILSERGLSISVLFPVPPEDFQYSKASPPKLILRIKYGKTSFLFIGDSTPKTQKFIAKNVGRTDVLITFTSLTDSNIAKELVAATNPKYVVYSALTKSKKEKPDGLAGVLLENRFNIWETGGVKIVSDGKTVTVNKI